jgi:hypothetical protein
MRSAGMNWAGIRRLAKPVAAVKEGVMTTSTQTGIRKSHLWGGAFFVGTLGMGGMSRALEWGGWQTMVAIMVPMLLLIPFIRSMEREKSVSGCYSPAMRAYNRRAIIFALSYMIALFAAIAATDALKPTGILAYALAVLPSLPIVYMVYSMGRYLTDEADEYLRMKAVIAALFGTGILLVVATFWGFLESFKLVPHQPGWWAVPIWAIGLGLGQLWQKVRGA